MPSGGEIFMANDGVKAAKIERKHLSDLVE